MSLIFLATLGQRPEAITVALDLLANQYVIQEVVILHTDPHYSGISTALKALRLVLSSDYPDVQVQWIELQTQDQQPIFDIQDQKSASAYYLAICYALLAYKQRGDRLHFLVSGGRKAMSIYATLAASLFFDDHDRVWTVLSPDELLRQDGVFHIHPMLRGQVQLVELPLLPAHLSFKNLPQDLFDDLENLLQQRQNRREDFLSRLTKAEQELADIITRHPYASMREWGAMLHKSPRTIENQLASIYDKMIGFMDFGDHLTDKKQALLDLLLPRTE